MIIIIIIFIENDDVVRNNILYAASLSPGTTPGLARSPLSTHASES